MKRFAYLLSPLLLIALIFNAVFACGPSYITPIFEYEHAPENPYENFAAGKIGVIKPTQRRIVLIAAYRYLNGSGYSGPEQQALVDVWNAEFNNKPFEKDDVEAEVKKWLEARKSIVGKEQKLPEIYVEREYGGYDFFPNCTKSSFETATATLKDRATSHGSDDPGVRNWIAAQDKVFENCASGRTDPGDPDASMPEWLQKDRAYQKAAADFYALDYDSAKRRFESIALDNDSPWRETADYLVARTLIRQASLTKDKSRAASLYADAELMFSRISSGGKFAASASKMIGLIKYRIRPQERVRELAQNIAFQGGENFRQDLVDYNWLMDKFEKESLENDEKLKAAEAARNSNEPTPTPEAPPTPEPADPKNERQENPEDVRVYLNSDDAKDSWTFFVNPAGTDEEAYAKAERFIGRPLSEKMKEQVRNARRDGFRDRYSNGRESEYEGGYYGSATLTLDVLPEFLRLDDLTNWLFAFQTQGDDAYKYSAAQWRSTGAQIWLITALSKAHRDSDGVERLLEAADKLDRREAAYPTAAYHIARLLVEQKKTAEARKLIDGVLDSTTELPISSRNLFLTLRTSLAEKLDDYLKYSLKTPFAYDWDGTSGTIQSFIDEQKSWYSAENFPDQTREQYEKDIEDNFRNEKFWEGRALLGDDSIQAMNEHFPLALLAETEKSPSLPDYMRERFAIAVWTRAMLLNDLPAAQKIQPELLKYHPHLEEALGPIWLAKTPQARQRALIFALLKNPMLTPIVEFGFGKTDNDFGQFDSNDWWCAPYATDEEGNATERSGKPAFLTDAQSAAAQAERKKLDALGDGPKFLGEKVLEWARLAPTDKRVPESLFIAWEANGWTKYGCGNNEELRSRIGEVLKSKFPQSEFVQKIRAVESEQ